MFQFSDFLWGLVLQGSGFTWVQFIRGHICQGSHFQGSHFSGVSIFRGHIFQGSSFSGVMSSGVRVSGVRFVWGQVFVGSGMVSF